MGLETGWNCHISLSESHTAHWEDHSSSSAMSERNEESLVDVRGAEGDAPEAIDEKHVSWMGVTVESAGKITGEESTGTFPISYLFFLYLTFMSVSC